jgi:hypothetical protein
MNIIIKRAFISLQERKIGGVLSRVVCCVVSETFPLLFNRQISPFGLFMPPLGKHWYHWSRKCFFHLHSDKITAKSINFHMDSSSVYAELQHLPGARDVMTRWDEYQDSAAQSQCDRFHDRHGPEL